MECRAACLGSDLDVQLCCVSDAEGCGTVISFAEMHDCWSPYCSHLDRANEFFLCVKGFFWCDAFLRSCQVP